MNKDSLWDLFSKFKLSSNESTQIEDTFQTVDVSKNTLPIHKQFEEEKMEVIEIMYCPPEYDDLHGERMSEIEIRKMVENFNLNIDKIKGNLGHVKNTDKFKPIKAWVNEVDCYIGETFVSEGTPLVKNKFYDAELYQMRKDGILQGVSIGALGETTKGE